MANARTAYYGEAMHDLQEWLLANTRLACIGGQYAVRVRMYTSVPRYPKTMWTIANNDVMGSTESRNAVLRVEAQSQSAGGHLLPQRCSRPGRASVATRSPTLQVIEHRGQQRLQGIVQGQLVGSALRCSGIESAALRLMSRRIHPTAS